MENAVPCGIIIEEAGDHNRVENDVQPEIKMFASCYSPGGEKPSYVDDLLHIFDIADESSLDGEVGKRLNQMVPVPHVPKTIEKIPTVDEEISDHQRLLERSCVIFSCLSMLCIFLSFELSRLLYAFTENITTIKTAFIIHQKHLNDP